MVEVHKRGELATSRSVAGLQCRRPKPAAAGLLPLDSKGGVGGHQTGFGLAAGGL